MQIVIEIPNEEVPTKQEIIDISLHFIAGEVCECTYPYTVLPKGHGILIDANELCEGRVSNDTVVIAAKCASTIIEADGGDAV